MGSMGSGLMNGYNITGVRELSRAWTNCVGCGYAVAVADGGGLGAQVGGGMAPLMMGNWWRVDTEFYTRLGRSTYLRVDGWAVTWWASFLSGLKNGGRKRAEESGRDRRDEPEVPEHVNVIDDTSSIGKAVTFGIGRGGLGNNARERMGRICYLLSEFLECFDAKGAGTERDSWE